MRADQRRRPADRVGVRLLGDPLPERVAGIDLCSGCWSSRRCAATASTSSAQARRCSSPRSRGWASAIRALWSPALPRLLQRRGEPGDLRAGARLPTPHPLRRHELAAQGALAGRARPRPRRPPSQWASAARSTSSRGLTKRAPRWMQPLGRVVLPLHPGAAPAGPPPPRTNGLRPCWPAPSPRADADSRGGYGSSPPVGSAAGPGRRRHGRGTASNSRPERRPRRSPGCSHPLACLTHDVTGRRGSALAYHAPGWRPAFPETHRLHHRDAARHAARTGDESLVARAREMGDWEIDVQNPTEVTTERRQVTARTIRCVQHGHGPPARPPRDARRRALLAAAVRAGEWPERTQTPKGPREGEHDYEGIPHAYTPVDWAPRLASPGHRQERSRRRRPVPDWVLSVQFANGWFDWVRLPPGDFPNSHGKAPRAGSPGEPARGGEQRPRGRAEDGTRASGDLPKRGWLPATERPRMTASARSSASRGSPKNGGVWSRLYQETGDVGSNPGRTRGRRAGRGAPDARGRWSAIERRRPGRSCLVVPAAPVPELVSEVPRDSLALRPVSSAMGAEPHPRRRRPRVRRRATIARVVEALRSQEPAPAEIIVVDDGLDRTGRPRPEGGRRGSSQRLSSAGGARNAAEGGDHPVVVFLDPTRSRRRAGAPGSSARSWEFPHALTGCARTFDSHTAWGWVAQPPGRDAVPPARTAAQGSFSLLVLPSPCPATSPSAGTRLRRRRRRVLRQRPGRRVRTRLRPALPRPHHDHDRETWPDLRRQQRRTAYGIVPRAGSSTRAGAKDRPARVPIHHFALLRLPVNLPAARELQPELSAASFDYLPRMVVYEWALGAERGALRRFPAPRAGQRDGLR